MRATARKRPPFMTLQRWIFLFVAALLLLITIVFIYFLDIQNPQRAAIEEAERQAIEAAGLTQVEHVYHQVWDKESWIVEGTDKDDEKVFVWLADESNPEIVKASSGISMQEMKTSFKGEHPNANIIRIQPGLLDNQRVWEVYYSSGDETNHYKYDFYSFDNGALINSYTLPNRTEP